MKYSKVYVSEKLNSYINLNINEFYNDCISRLLINKITSCLKKDKTLSIIIINDSTIEEDSLFISEICRQNDVMFMPTVTSTFVTSVISLIFAIYLV